MAERMAEWQKFDKKTIHTYYFLYTMVKLFARSSDPPGRTSAMGWLMAALDLIQTLDGKPLTLPILEL